MENFFRDKLLKYASPVDEDMWARIQQKKKKKRRLFFLQWLLLIMLVLSTCGYFIFKAGGSKGNAIEVKKNSVKKNDDTVKYVAGNMQANSKVTPADTVIIDNRAVETTANAPLQSRIDNNNFHKGRIPQKAQNTRTVHWVKRSAGVLITNADYDSSDDTLQHEIAGRQYLDADIAIIKVIPHKTTVSKKILSLFPEQIKKKMDVVTKEKGQWFLEIYASPAIPFFAITPGEQSVVNSIKYLHRAQASYSAGVDIGKAIGKHFSVKTGLQYLRTQEKFINDSVALTFASNHYNSVGLSVLAGYKISSKRFITTVNAGIIVNLDSWYKGTTFTASGFADVNNTNTFKRNTGCSLYAGLSFAAFLNEKIQLFAEPYFRYQLSNMTTTQALFKQKINVAGISFGVKYNF